MRVEILQRERLTSSGGAWYRYWGAVNGVKVGIRIPAAYVESVSSREADAEVREALQDEYERTTLGPGSVFTR